MHHASVRLPNGSPLKSAFGEQPTAGVGSESPPHDAMMKDEANGENGGDDFTSIYRKMFGQLGLVRSGHIHACEEILRE